MVQIDLFVVFADQASNKHEDYYNQKTKRSYSRILD